MSIIIKNIQKERKSESIIERYYGKDSLLKEISYQPTIKGASKNESGKDGKADFLIETSIEKAPRLLIEVKKSIEQLEQAEEEVLWYGKFASLEEDIILCAFAGQDNNFSTSYYFLEKGKLEPIKLDYDTLTPIKKIIATIQKIKDVKILEIIEYNSNELADLLGTETRKLYNILIAKKPKSIIKIFDMLDPKIKDEEKISNFSQMLTYMLFITRLTTDNNEPITKDNYLRIINTSGFIYNLAEITHSKRVITKNKDINKILDTICDIINSTNIFKIKEEQKTEHFLYFFETFLQSFDSNYRKEKGVFYTPEIIVNRIISNTGFLLKKHFHLPIKSKNIGWLDFATGTGTFMLSIYQHILNTCTDAEKQDIIPNHLLKNVYGFELMLAPFMVANIKLQEFLQNECNYKLKEYEEEDLKKIDRGFVYNAGYEQVEEIQIKLTNTLSSGKQQQIVDWLFPFIDKNAVESYEIKQNFDDSKTFNRKIFCIVGNPPYLEKCDIYYDSVKKWQATDLKSNQATNNMYCQFMKFASDMVQKQGEGIISIIVPNTFLNGIAFKVMRKYLFENFNYIYIDNLNNFNRMFDADAKVFNDVLQPVTTIYLVKQKECTSHKVFYHTLGGKTKEEKFTLLEKNGFEDIDWENSKALKKHDWKLLSPTEPYYDFTREVVDNSGMPLVDIFDISGDGVKTHRNETLLKFTKDEAFKVAEDFNKLSIEELRKKYPATEEVDNEERTTEKAKESIVKLDKNKVIKYNVKPFDFEYLYYEVQAGFILRPRADIMLHLFNTGNIALAINKKSDCFIVNNITDTGFFPSVTHIFPLYIYNKNKEKELNFTNSSYTESHFYFIAGALNDTKYKEQYLKDAPSDFPAIVFDVEKTEFDRLGQKGRALADLFLMKNKIDGDFGRFYGNDFMVSKVKLESGKLYINANSYFDISQNESIFEYRVCGYLVLKNWLSKRKDTLIDSEYVEQLIKTLNELQKFLV